MSASDTPSFSLPERLTNDRRFVRAFLLARGLAAVEWIAVLAVVATPFALAADYRLGLAPVGRAYSFRPIAENGGYPVSYEQLFGWTQIVWLLAGAVALVIRRTRQGFWSAPTALLALFAGVLTVVTAATGGIEQFAAFALCENVLPLVAMCGLLLHPGVTRRTIVWMIAYFGVASAATVLATVIREGIHHQLTDRFSIFIFGSPTYAAAALVAMTLVIMAARPGPRSFRIALICLLTVAVVLTQTRGALVGAAGGLLCVAVLNRRARLPALLGVLVAVALLVFGPIRPLNNTSNIVRTRDVGHHLHVLASRPLVGYGIANRYADAFRGADNTLVGIADASGGLGAIIWTSAWLLPVGLLLRARRLNEGTSFAVGAVAATFATWLTTGNEVLIYAPPTNLLPLVFAVALIEVARRDPSAATALDAAGAQADVASTRRLPRFALPGAAVILLSAGAVARATPARIPVATNEPTMSYRGDSARALAAAEGLAFSSCDRCHLISLVEVSPRIWQARLSRRDLKPSACFRLDLKEFEPRPPGLLPPGMNWLPCAPELDRYGTVTPPSPKSPPSDRERSIAHSFAKSVAETACRNCRIRLVARVAIGLWRWRVIGVDVKPSPCFYVFLDEYRSGAPDSRATTWVSCSRN